MEISNELMYDTAFKAAVDIIQNVPKKGVISISTNQKLRFYSLFKQAINGKCNTPCPPVWHTVDRLKWRAWNALGSMDSLEAKKTYVAEFKNIIDRAQHEYDIAELTKGCDERMEKLLREKLSILGYDVNGLKMKNLDDFRKQSCNPTKESFEMRKHINGNEINELSDQRSESSTPTGEYADAVCCDHELCICCRERLLNSRKDYREDQQSFSFTSDIEKLKMTMHRYLKVFVNLLMYLRRLFATFLLNFKGYIGNRWRLAAFITIVPFIAHFLMSYSYQK
ncbi:acyl CoA binding protein [Onchocerca flexuosa]|uniref:Acyl CoA binding protein n=1 Tax=Onchocerca flexuosa TaxID=387005 RepID=A0A238BMS5_9BILA|nr:acyl CoA binding protein [Onchocerca flexuosa]